MKKQCSHCHQSLELFSFGKDKSQKDGLSVYCKPCKLIFIKRYRLAHPDRVLEYVRCCHQKRHLEALQLVSGKEVPICAFPFKNHFGSLHIHHKKFKKFSLDFLRGSAFYRRILKLSEKQLKEYVVLCAKHHRLVHVIFDNFQWFQQWKTPLLVVSKFFIKKV